MHDHFDDKRGMVQKLLAMLKSHAVNEVEGGLKRPEGMPEDAHGIEIEHVEALPAHEMDEPTPEHDVITKMAKGGYADAPKKAIPYESADGQSDKEGSAHEEATESTMEREEEGDIEPVSEPTSMFSSLFIKKKKK